MTPLNRLHLKMVKVVNLMLCVFFHNSIFLTFFFFNTRERKRFLESLPDSFLKEVAFEWDPGGK